MRKTIYLDHAATTPLDERVLEKMLPYLKNQYGNASSIHQLGREAKSAVETAREHLASAINAEPSEIIFTSGGTESDNAALHGVLAASERRGLITSNAEHHAILHPADEMAQGGVATTFIPANHDGVVTAERLQEHISDQTALVSLMHVNNESGSINELKSLAEVAHEQGALFHSDAVQSFTKLPIDIQESNVDLLSFSSHKIYGPKGVGALFIKNGIDWKPLQSGGSQERNRRGGTLNVPGIVGFGEAVRLAMEEFDSRIEHLANLKTYLLKSLKTTFGDQVLFNQPENGAPHIVNISFNTDEPVDGEMLLMNLDMAGICVSNGSACTSGVVEPSHVLLAMGRSAEVAKSSVRLSVGMQNTKTEIDRVVDELSSVVQRFTKSPVS